MCVNFRSPDRADIEAILAEDVQDDAYNAREVWPRRLAPIVRRDGRTGKRAIELAVFGLLPHWAKEPKIAHSTMNARCETVASLASFRDVWKRGNFCLVPMQCYYEPNWETGKAVRWSIARDDGAFAVAGLWSWWPGRGEQQGMLSFTLLTANCDSHPVLSRFHGPEDEKRSLIHVRRDEYDAWLDASPELARAMIELPDADRLVVAASPTPLRTKKTQLSADV